MGRTRKHAHAALGRSLVNTKKSTQGDKSAHQERLNVHEEKTHALKSVTEESSYDEFIATAALAEKEFTAEKLNVKFVGLTVTSAGAEPEDLMTLEERKCVVVPRRPKWTTSMTAEELDTLEKEAFLNWRRGMAHLQNKQDITPFERNIEVWRQLWRVLERSQVIVQIVDGRNPLLYRNEDLEKYVEELGKKNVILINKADFLSDAQRAHWADYFKSVNLPHAFYSAAMANDHLTSKEIQEEEEDRDSSSGDSSDEEDEVKVEVVPEDPPVAKLDEKVKVLNREELIEFLKSFRTDESNSDVFSVGLVGYPNVGKSSTINSLMGVKRTSVSATPGKTKHFQTLFLEKDLLLCDCPGLVMPAHGGSKGEMILGGILPIDQLTSYSAAASLLVHRFSKEKLEKTYGISLPPNFTGDDLLSAYAAIRGFMTVRGIPDSSRAARIILKNYVNGKLLFCHSPPILSQEEFQTIGLSGDNPYSAAAAVLDGDLEVENQRPTTIRTVNVEKRLDSNFFAPPTAQVHFKGRHMIASGLTASGVGGNPDKPWRKHNNKNKKEKLRRVYRHLDVE